jgi:hypothetical protein
VKPFEFRQEGKPYGGFDVERHNVELDIDETLYARIKLCQKTILDLMKLGANPYSLEIWYGFYAYEQDWGVEGDDPDNGPEVDSECEMIRIMDHEILLTYYEDNREGVYWETDIVPIKLLDEHFATQEKS